MTDAHALRIRVPGDKSVTHRALLFGALCHGTMYIRAPLVAADTRATAAVLRQLGVEIPDLTRDGLSFPGVGLTGLKAAEGILDCGNSGTTARLLLGILAGQRFATSLTGDDSLRSRPMRRVTDPLSKMGARFTWQEEDGRMPLTVYGGELRSIDIETGVASAQVKSAILLAALTSGVFALVTEPRQSRDHTERLLAAMGAATVRHHVNEGWRVELRDPPEAIRGVDVTVPGDFSTAAFPLVWGVCRSSGPPLVLEGVGLNPTRTGLLDVLERMGAEIEVVPEVDGAEPTGTLIAHPSQLVATHVDGSEIPAMVDEIPALAVAALFAEGETVITGAGELRVKESDRIDALARNLERVGAHVVEAPDGLTIRGPLRSPSGRVASFHDHRVEMAFGVLEALTHGGVHVETRGAAGVSYPEFWSDLERLASAQPSHPTSTPNTRRRKAPIVTIDGPAGSGKSTTARAVAGRLGLVHLDSGALYRGIAFALLEAGVPPDRWDSLSEADIDALGLEARLKDGALRLSLGGRPVPDGSLRTDAVTAAVSRVAALSAVRNALIHTQRNAAADGGLVSDGRDMGTVVFPDADVKVFLVADLEERARRRVEERASGEPSEESVAVMAQRLQARDFEDSHREHSPLRKPADAVVIDTTSMKPEEQVQRVLDEVRAVWRPEG